MAAGPDWSEKQTTLFAALIAAASRHGPAKIALEDVDGVRLSYRDLIRNSLVLGARLAAFATAGKTVGVLLPASAGAAVSLFALNAWNRVPALLNFTAGPGNLLASVRVANVDTVITSRRFAAAAGLDDRLSALREAGRGSDKPLSIVYLEDVRAAVGLPDKIAGFLRSLAPGWVHAAAGAKPESPAAILFTSGTEGAPKGVVLTNANLLANVRQGFAHAAAVLSPADIWLSPLPLFHAFGLTAGLLLPLFNGIKVVLHPSPLRYREVAALARRARPTILVATDTFLQGYARAAHEGDFSSLRFVIAGAERVKPETRALWEKLGVTLLEGYGVTECSPIVSFNLPGSNRPGTAGRLLPGMEARIEPVAGIPEGGKLLLRGPNVMAGYLDSAAPGTFAPPPGGWHDTGDIVTLEEGFLRIHGRLKRFAKIGGEMVPLTVIENLAAGVWPEAHHAAVAVPSPRKGEQTVLVTEQAGATQEALLAFAREKGLPELWVPKAVVVVEKLPLLGSGKADLAAIETLARARVARITL